MKAEQDRFNIFGQCHSIMRLLLLKAPSFPIRFRQFLRIHVVLLQE
jgi:hypothetical protein